jgi:hypothetical protein
MVAVDDHAFLAFDEGFDLPVQFTHAPAFGHALAGVKVAGGLALEWQQLQEVGPAQLSHQ